MNICSHILRFELRHLPKQLANLNKNNPATGFTIVQNLSSKTNSLFSNEREELKASQTDGLASEGTDIHIQSLIEAAEYETNILSQLVAQNGKSIFDEEEELPTRPENPDEVVLYNNLASLKSIDQAGLEAGEQKILQDVKELEKYIDNMSLEDVHEKEGGSKNLFRPNVEECHLLGNIAETKGPKTSQCASTWSSQTQGLNLVEKFGSSLAKTSQSSNLEKESHEEDHEFLIDAEPNDPKYEKADQWFMNMLSKFKAKKTVENTKKEVPQIKPSTDEIYKAYADEAQLYSPPKIYKHSSSTGLKLEISKPIATQLASNLFSQVQKPKMAEKLGLPLKKVSKPETTPKNEYQEWLNELQPGKGNQEFEKAEEWFADMTNGSENIGTKQQKLEPINEEIGNEIRKRSYNFATPQLQGRFVRQEENIQTETTLKKLEGMKNTERLEPIQLRVTPFKKEASASGNLGQLVADCLNGQYKMNLNKTKLSLKQIQILAGQMNSLANQQKAIKGERPLHPAKPSKHKVEMDAVKQTSVTVKPEKHSFRKYLDIFSQILPSWISRAEKI